eukprot:SAG31_NODE_48_length_30945_cov_16.254263_3_plen_192_part_00
MHVARTVFPRLCWAGCSGSPWTQTFHLTCSQDKSGEISYDEFRMVCRDYCGKLGRLANQLSYVMPLQVIRKGARLSPTIVSEAELKKLFEAVDLDGGGSVRTTLKARSTFVRSPRSLDQRMHKQVSAKEFADFLSPDMRQAEDGFGRRRGKLVKCTPSKLVLLDGALALQVWQTHCSFSRSLEDINKACHT